MTPLNGHAGPFLTGTQPVLITGGAGFIGCNLADRLASDGHDVLILDALSRPGVEDNLIWLKRRHPRRITSVIADIRDHTSVAAASRDACAVFHLAAQVAVTTSLTEPRHDFEVNIGGTVLLLDALRRRADPPPLVFASTNKVYGNLADIDLQADTGRYLPADRELREHGIGEQRPLSFHTPYGCSKGAADQYVLDFAHSYGVPTVVLRMSCIYGEHQHGTEDQGWVACFARRALGGEQITIYGDGRQVRDVLHVGDAVAAYIAAWQRARWVAGQAFNLGGGPGNAVSLLDVIEHIQRTIARRVDLRFGDWRTGDQRYFVADTRRATRLLDLRPPRHWRRGLDDMIAWLQQDESAAVVPAVGPAITAKQHETLHEGRAGQPLVEL